MRILAIFGVLVLGVLLIFVGAGGALWYSGRLAGAPTAIPPVTVAAPVPQPAPRWHPSPGELDQLSLEKIRALLSVADATRRREVLESPERFAQFVRQEAANQSLVAAAIANKTDDQPGVRVLMDRAAHQIVAEAYMNRVVELNADPDFPSDEDIQTFYDKNAETFVLADRVHLWQIFFPLAKDAPPADVKALAAKVSGISTALRNGKADFAAMVAKYSGHPPSRLNDGYMGLLKLDELLPEIRGAVDTLKPGKISEPLRTASGFHIIRRGDIVAGSPVELAQLKPQIRRQLLQQAGSRIRQGAIEKIAEKYPVALPDGAPERWREELLADATKESAGTIVTQAPPGASREPPR